MIKSTYHLVERFKKERDEYEEYTKRITPEKIDLAREKLNDRDIKTLKLINRLKICTSTQIAKVIYKETKYGIKYCNNGLRKLFQLGCIDRFFPFTITGSSPVHVILAPIGARIIGDDKFRKVYVLNQNWKHTVLTNDVFSEIYFTHTLTDWKTEIVLEWKTRSKEHTMRPDAFCGWKTTEEKEIFAMIEVDRGTESIQELHNKVKNYDKYFSSDEFKKAYWQPYENVAIIPKVFFILTDYQRIKKLKSFISKFKSDVFFEVQHIDSLSF